MEETHNDAEEDDDAMRIEGQLQPVCVFLRVECVACCVVLLCVFRDENIPQQIESRKRDKTSKLKHILSSSKLPLIVVLFDCV
jgi:hypothetical protein